MRGRVLVLTVALLVSACQPKKPATIDDEALVTLTQTVEDELNAPGVAVIGLLRSQSQKAQVGWDDLVIGLDDPEPINWWLQKRGFIAFAGAAFVGHASYVLTEPVQTLLANADPAWFEVSAGEPKVDCESPEAMAAVGCEVEVEMTPALTDAGKAFAGTAKLTPFKVTAIVSSTGEEWQISNLSTDGASLHEIAMTAIFGPPEQRKAEASSAYGALNGRLKGMAGITDETGVPTPVAAPPPIEPDLTPVAPPPPVTPLSRPDSPFRPGR